MPATHPEKPTGLRLSISSQAADGGGASVTAVIAKGPAGKAGILAGNVIEQINGQPATAATLQSQLHQLAQAGLPAATLLITGDTANGTDPGPRWVSVPLPK